MRRFLALWLAATAWLGRAAPETGPARGEEERRSVRDVTLEQLGIADWSCHPHY